MCVVFPQDLVNSSPSLASLAVPQCSRLAGAVVNRLPEKHPNLQTLNVAECRGIPGSALAFAVPQLMALNRVVLDGMSEVRGP